MKIIYTPVSSFKPHPEVSGHGDTLVVGGYGFDLSGIPAGGSLPVPHDLVHSARRGENGTLHVKMAWRCPDKPLPEEKTEDLPDEGAWDGEVTVVAPEPFTVEDVKAEAERRILAVMPEHQQRNTSARGVEVLFEIMATGRDMTDDEQQELAEGQAAFAYIKAVRTASNQMEALDPIPDPATWGGWP